MSKFLNRFAISFVSLNEGKHYFDFEINNLFFENFELSEIRQGIVKVDVVLEKQTSMLTLTFKINGSVNVDCDLCLDEVSLPIVCTNILYVKLANDYSEESEDVITIPRNCNDINVAQYIYEFIYLALPIKRVHPDDEDGKSTCNPQMIERINSLKSNNSNNTTWDVLKNLNKN